VKSIGLRLGSVECCIETYPFFMGRSLATKYQLPHRHAMGLGSSNVLSPQLSFGIARLRAHAFRSYYPISTFFIPLARIGEDRQRTAPHGEIKVKRTANSEGPNFIENS